MLGAPPKACNSSTTCAQADSPPRSLSYIVGKLSDYIFPIGQTESFSKELPPVPNKLFYGILFPLITKDRPRSGSPPRSAPVVQEPL